MTIRPGRASPTSVLALVLVVGGLVFLMRDRMPASSAYLACDPGVDPACAEDGTPIGTAPGPAVGTKTGPVLRAADACFDVAYLCAGLATDEQVLIHRWRGFQGTLVVHIPEPQIGDAAQAHALQRAATAGIRLWNGQPFPILADERGTRTAHVEVRWVHSIGGMILGQARTQWSSRTGLQVLSIELVTAPPGGGGRLDPRSVRLTAAHEMGHALGLPHSDNPRDVMYPTNTATALSARDYRTLEALYDIEDGTVIVR